MQPVVLPIISVLLQFIRCSASMLCSPTANLSSWYSRKCHALHTQLYQLQKSTVAGPIIKLTSRIPQCWQERQDYMTRVVKKAIEIRLHPDNFNRNFGLPLNCSWFSATNITKHTRKTKKIVRKVQRQETRFQMTERLFPTRSAARQAIIHNLTPSCQSRQKAEFGHEPRRIWNQALRCWQVSAAIQRSVSLPILPHTVRARMDESFLYKYSVQTQRSSHETLIIDQRQSSEHQTSTPH